MGGRVREEECLCQGERAICRWPLTTELSFGDESPAVSVQTRDETDKGQEGRLEKQ